MFLEKSVMTFKTTARVAFMVHTVQMDCGCGIASVATLEWSDTGWVSACDNEMLF